MRSDSDPASSDSDGVIRMPPTAASPTPTAQLIRAMRSGRAPLSSASDRSSTLARIETPMRVRYNSQRRPTATAIATPIVIAWW
jgi:hypothetical protein